MYTFEPNNCKEENKEKKNDFCVKINIFCDEKKEKEEYKKDGHKEDDFCVEINIFCDDCKKYHY